VRSLRFIALVAVALSALASCTGSGPSPSPNPLDLDGTTWRAILVRDAAPIAGAEPTIRFEAGQASGTTGCNSYGGGYRLDGTGAFDLDDSLLMTEMACDGVRATQEGAVIEILTAADRIQLADGHLKISGPAGSITFVQVQG
jgi:heat shock protein HslJ